MNAPNACLTASCLAQRILCSLSSLLYPHSLAWLEAIAILNIDSHSYLIHSDSEAFHNTLGIFTGDHRYLVMPCFHVPILCLCCVASSVYLPRR